MMIHKIASFAIGFALLSRGLAYATVETDYVYLFDTPAFQFEISSIGPMAAEPNTPFDYSVICPLYCGPLGTGWPGHTLQFGVASFDLAQYIPGYGVMNSWLVEVGIGDNGGGYSFVFPDASWAETGVITGSVSLTGNYPIGPFSMSSYPDGTACNDCSVTITTASPEPGLTALLAALLAGLVLAVRRRLAINPCSIQMRHVHDTKT
jgi:MYXO-CTERM domain-containing protein